MKTRYRSSQIIIDSPKSGGDVLLNISVQKIDVDDDNNIIYHEYPTTEHIHRLAANIAMDQVNITDPINGNDLTISIAGIHMAIEQYVCKWLMEEHPECRYDGEYVWE